MDSTGPLIKGTQKESSMFWKEPTCSLKTCTHLPLEGYMFWEANIWLFTGEQTLCVLNGGNDSKLHCAVATLGCSSGTDEQTYGG